MTSAARTKPEPAATLPAGGERGFFFGRPAEPCFGMLSAPGGPPDRTPAGAALLCGPLGHEHGFAQRLFAEWARTLAGAGLWTLRFDYRGHGDAGGRFQDREIGDYLEDIAAAREELVRRSGVSSLVLCGLRFGATLALLWAREHDPRGRLVLWEPVLSGRSYLGGLRRIELVKRMAARNTGSGEAGAGAGALARGAGGGAVGDSRGSIVVEGAEWTPRAMASIAPVDIEAALRSAEPRRLVVRTAAPARPRGEGTGAEGCPAGGRPGDGLRGTGEGARAEPSDGTSIFVATPPLWYGSFVREYRARIRPEELFARSLRWILAGPDALLAPPTREGGSPPEPSRPSPNGALPAEARVAVESPEPAAREPEAPAIRHGEGTVRESPVTIPGRSGTLRGILTLPEHDPRPGPVVVLAPQGFNARAGWNRLYVTLARDLALRGFPSLRFDAGGLGDSDGRVDLELGSQVFLAIERGLHLDDASRAVSWARERFPRSPLVLSGACGGAVTAALLARGDPRLAGIALLELPFVLTQDPGTKTPHPLWKYRGKLLSAASWRRVFLLRADLGVHLRSLREFFSRRRAASVGSPAENWYRRQLGPFANLELFAAFRIFLERGLSTLFVFGTTENYRSFDQVRSRLLAPRSDGRPAPVTERVVEGADHDFLHAPHAAECVAVLGAWLEGLPCAGSGEPEAPGP